MSISGTAKTIDIARAKFYSYAMQLKVWPVIFLLAFALLIQNTCPFGAAGKSTVAHECGHCPMKQGSTISPLGEQSLVSDASSVHFPLYVFAVPKTIHTFQLEPITSVRPVLTNGYKDALPYELLRPPRA
jgi:hypothetical protein